MPTVGKAHTRCRHGRPLHRLAGFARRDRAGPSVRTWGRSIGSILCPGGLCESPAQQAPCASGWRCPAITGGPSRSLPEASPSSAAVGRVRHDSALSLPRHGERGQRHPCAGVTAPSTSATKALSVACPRSLPRAHPKEPRARRRRAIAESSAGELTRNGAHREGRRRLLRFLRLLRPCPTPVLRTLSLTISLIRLYGTGSSRGMRNVLLAAGRRRSADGTLHSPPARDRARCDAGTRQRKSGCREG